MRIALVHVRLAPRPREPLRAIARERTGRVDAHSVVFARRSLFAFVDVFGTIHSFVAGRT